MRVMITDASEERDHSAGGGFRGNESDSKCGGIREAAQREGVGVLRVER